MDAVPMYRLADVCNFTRGITYSKYDEAKSGIAVLRANNIDVNGNTLNLNELKHVDTSVKIKPTQFLHADDILICAGSGSKDHVGKVAYISEETDFAFGGFMSVVRINNISELLPKYVFYNLTSTNFRQYLRATIETSTINNLNFKILSNYQIPIPPIEEQTRIVNILDRFSVATNELTSLLQKELEFRRKQYEYYRDELLSFKSEG